MKLTQKNVSPEAMAIQAMILEKRSISIAIGVLPVVAD
jgi:hypothetical protein